MHPLRTLLVVSLVLAGAVAWGFTAALERGGVAHAEAVAIGIASFVAFLLPWGAVTLWALRRADDLETLSERTRRAAAGQTDLPIADREFHAELDDLARGIEELRAIVIRQQRSFDEHRAAMSELVASLGEGVMAVSRRGSIVFANARVAEIFSAGGEMTGRPFLEIVRRQSLAAAFDKAFAGEASSDRIAVGPPDDERQIEIRVFPVAASTEIAAVALFIDITQLERLQRIRRDFLDDFSHEVRTPLAGLRSATETFEQGGLTAEQEEQLRHVMLRQLGRIERLVKDIAELNQIESGDLVLDRDEVDLRELLEAVCGDFRGRTGIAIALHGDGVIALADPLRAQQIFVNLIDNAWKHGGAGKPIDVEVAAEEGAAVVRVSDRGEGIPATEIDRIFNRFYRIDRSRSQVVPGVGLGLAIAKHLVLLHGGTIRATNRAGGGATFEVRLPRPA